MSADLTDEELDEVERISKSRWDDGDFDARDVLALIAEVRRLRAIVSRAERCPIEGCDCPVHDPGSLLLPTVDAPST